MFTHSLIQFSLVYSVRKSTKMQYLDKCGDVPRPNLSHVDIAKSLAMTDFQTQESPAGECSSSEQVINLFSGLQELFDREQVRKEVLVTASRCSNYFNDYYSLENPDRGK